MKKVNEEGKRIFEEDSYELAQLCEVAYITGVKVGKNEIEPAGEDIEGMLNSFYLPILNEWENGTDETFENEEERGYIGAFVQRRIVEVFNNQVTDTCKCPLGGDESNDCLDCYESGDYHFVNNECIER